MITNVYHLNILMTSIILYVFPCRAINVNGLAIAMKASLPSSEVSFVRSLVDLAE